jgi:hypothetical protein
MDPGTWVAGYAAVVSTVVAVQQWRKDRLRVRVAFATTPDSLIINVANMSSRPIFLEYIGIIGNPRHRKIHVHPVDPADFRADRSAPALEPGQKQERQLDADALGDHVAQDRRWITVQSATGRSYNKRIPDDTITRVLGRT